jgi:lycopene cyclase domain-containing protein
MSLYAWLMLGSLVGPLLLSFDKKVAFYKWWPRLFAGIGINMVLFILWDSWFTINNVWAFDNDYVWSTRLLQLPIEEWSFFVVVPYASIFIYACLTAYLSDKWWSKKVAFFNWFFIALCVLGIAFYGHKTYTLVNLSIALLLLLLQQFVIKGKYLGYFWFAYFVHLIPFLIVNGVLTGAVTPKPIVWYNPEDIIGWRIYTIPVEDTIYALTCLLLPITVLEYLKTK